ncbi:hypothetical protein [Thermochromatium tepidum]|jgi:hypothetical protein|uniref:Glutamate-ammonia-ligase adenylyltransferase n=1 Tax=Thermochromatium tepidum ATCC 43061 TaxID=316276 RepID=A0A6I6E9S0_THETI|nr:hypothetical protein [Thermochromatium tepidum]QGU31679.1 hypothetical protein E6P07_00910 [Thermochromatium tepidum ATCC 43061]
MDRFTRNYSLLLGAVLIAALFFWVKSTWRPDVWKLDEVLTSDAKLAEYPYQFRVRDFRNGVAVISTPRSPDFPAYSFLQVIHPKLAGKAQDDPEMIAAQQDLIDHQKRAMGLILAQPGVKGVDWELDVKWLAEHGIHR